MKQATTETMLVTVSQAAKALQVSERTIFNLISKGELASVQIASTRRIDIDELKRLASVGTVERTGQVGRHKKIRKA